MDNTTLQLIAGPAGAVVVLAVVAFLLWRRNDALTDTLIQLVKESVKQDADTAATLRELAALIRGKP